MADKTVTVKASGGSYTSLQGALAGESANLVTNTCILTIECYAIDDTTQIDTGTGYTTNASYYINITVPSAQRHAGVWDGDKYNLVVPNQYDFALYIQASYTRMTGLQMSRTHAGATAAIIGFIGSNNLIDSCIIYRPDSAGNGHGIARVINTTVRNTIVYGASITVGLETYYTNTASYIYNCVFSGAVTAGIVVYGTLTTAKNCALFNNADDFSLGGGTFTIDYCASDDADGTNHVHLNENASGEWAAAFTDYANGDFSLKAGGALIDVGVDLSGTFTTDIAGTTRTGTWDIGAFNYAVAAGAIKVDRTSPIGMFRGMFKQMTPGSGQYP